MMDFLRNFRGNIDISPKGRYVVPSILALIAAIFGAWAVVLFSGGSDFWFPFILSMIFLAAMFLTLIVSQNDGDKRTSAPEKFVILAGDNSLRTLLVAKQARVYEIEDLSEELDDLNTN